VLFEELINHFGSQREMARVLGVSEAAVSQWRVRGVAFRQALRIEHLTKGAFKAVDIVKMRGGSDGGASISS
jgi:transcriptional repressor of cell division inhibition gene dicB